MKVFIWRYCTLGMAVRPEIQLATLVVFLPGGGLAGEPGLDAAAPVVQNQRV